MTITLYFYSSLLPYLKALYSLIVHVRECLVLSKNKRKYGKAKSLVLPPGRKAWEKAQNKPLDLLCPDLHFAWHLPLCSQQYSLSCLLSVFSSRGVYISRSAKHKIHLQKEMKRAEECFLVGMLTCLMTWVGETLFSSCLFSWLSFPFGWPYSLLCLLLVRR